MKFFTLSLFILLISGCATQSEIITSNPGWQVQDSETKKGKASDEPETIDLRDIF